ncbi:MAG: hypothetical protein CTY29_08675 [Methylobacter sp.]|nr:MAG: hypothetical protein CTY29_08675 [Methylobacter sp.]PPD23465.1 MAG: hypothetical protein CTY24_04160 [Methylobacter sp.]
METPTYIKTTQDGRKLEVIGRAIYLGGKKECDKLMHLSEHPQVRAIIAVEPDARYMAGRVLLTEAEAAIAKAALDAANDEYNNTPFGINERMRTATKDLLRLRVDE